MKLGLSMVVKDETFELERMFQSILPIHFDEICVAFTGSNPITRSVLEKYGAQIYEFDWIDDFSAARNFIYNKANSDYVMWLDADDSVENADLLRSEFDKVVIEKWTEIQFEYKYRFDASGNCTCSFFRERIVKRNLYHWVGSVHETLDCLGERKALRLSNVHVLHHNWQIDRARLERNLRLSEIAYLKQGYSLKAALYYGQSLYDIGRFKEAIPVLEEFVIQVQEDQFKVYALFLQFHACMDAYLRDEALVACNKAEKYWPECGEIFYRQALVYFTKCEWKKVIELCEKCFASSMPMGTAIPLNPLNYTLKPAKLLTEALVADGRWFDGLKIVEHTLKSFPNDVWLNGARKDLVFKYLQEVHRGGDTKNNL